MRDAIGNSISDKSVLCWHPDPEQVRRGLICQVVHVSDGGISMGDSNRTTPPMLAVQILIPVGNVRPGEEPTLGEFLCLVNPNAEAAVERMLEGQRRQ